MGLGIPKIFDFGPEPTASRPKIILNRMRIAFDFGPEPRVSCPKIKLDDAVVKHIN